MKNLMQSLSILCVGILVLVSCNKENGTEIPSEDFYTVEVKLGGEISIGYEPLTKSSSNDLYAIQVYSTPDIELEDGEEPVWTPYAQYYSIGSAPTTITLVYGYKYSFMADLIIDGNNKLSITLRDSQGCAPWLLVSSSDYDAAQCHALVSSDSFQYCTEHLITIAGSAVLLGENGDYYTRPNIDRYLGKLDNFVPSVDNKTVNIAMKRVSFGAKFVFSGDSATSGTIGIEIDGAPKQTLVLSENPDDNVHFDIYTFARISSGISNEYTETIPVKLSWTRTDGTVDTIGQFDIVYQRNTTTVVTVQLDDDIEGSMGINIPESESGTMLEPGTNDVTIIDGEIQ